MELDNERNNVTGKLIRTYYSDYTNNFKHRLFIPLIDNEYDYETQIEPEDLFIYSQLSGIVNYAVVDSCSLEYYYSINLTGMNDDEQLIYYILLD